MADPVNIGKSKKREQQSPTPHNTPVFHTLPTAASKKAPAQAIVEESLVMDSNRVTEMLMRNPALQQALQGQLANLIGRSSGYIDSLPAEVKRRLDALRNLQDEHGKIDLELQKEIAALERKYLEKFAPIYKKRADIVNGAYEPTDAEAERPADEEDVSDDLKGKARITELGDDGKEKESEKVKGIPEFWLTALQTHAVIEGQITEEDVPILRHLTDIQLTSLPNGDGFKIHFHFSPNDYFTDAVLTKTYYLEWDEEEAEQVFSKAEGQPIAWKPGKNVTVKLIKKKQKHKAKGTTRTVTKEVPTDSFFNFFNPPAMPEEEEEGDDDEEQDEAKFEAQQKIALDFEMGDVLRTQIIPNAVNWFTGEAQMDEEEDEDYDEMDDEDGDDDGDDDDDDEDRDPSFDPKQAAKQQPPECKQQ
eukprot:Opistho-1_new@103809